MEQTEVFDWQIFTFVSSEAAYNLARELIADAQDAATEGGGDTTEAEE